MEGQNISTDKEKKELRVCRKCLLYAENREHFFRKLQAYIADLDEDDRTDQDTYEARLRSCAQCRYLVTDGMCALCGCYVELRAALKVRRCPDIVRRW